MGTTHDKYFNKNFDLHLTEEEIEIEADEDMENVAENAKMLED